MRLPISLTLMFFLFIVLAGCSSSKNPATQPSIPDGEFDANGTGLLYSGTFDIDLETLTITQTSRQSDAVYNITGFLPDQCPDGCFTFKIINVVGSVLEIELTIENPINIQVYDLRIQYIDLFGKTVLNPDSYTDFLGAPTTVIFPFTAFAKENPDRAFPIGPGGIDTEILFLDFPPGAQSAVNYAITAHLPGQTPEPYEIGNMSQTGNLTTTGGSSTISCRVDDHQDDISDVFLDASPFTGGTVAMSYNAPNYEVEISNTQGAPIGTYNQLIMAQSSNVQNISTYNYVEVTVSNISSDLFACFIYDPEVIRMELDDTVDFDGSCSHDDGGFDITDYEWDFDWDGIPGNFTVDDNTTTPTTSHTYMAPGTFTVGLRVINNNTPPETSGIISSEIIVHGWIYPPIKLSKTDVSYTDMWWCVDPKITTTSNGIAHVIADNYYAATNETKMEYYKCDSTGILYEEVLYEGYISDMGILTTDDDSVYVFRMDGTGDILYQKNSGSGFDPDVYCMSREPGKNADYAAYAVNSDGNILVVMSEYGGEDPLQTIPNPVYISYSIDEGAGFSPKTTVHTLDRWLNYEPPGSGQGYGITVGAIADLNGVFHMSWDGLPGFGINNRQIWAAYYDGSLSAVEEIASTGTSEYFPLLRVDGDNNLWCGYRTYTENWITIKRNGSSTWDPGFRSAAYPANNYSYDINPDNGEILHLWTQKDMPQNQYHNWFKFYNTTDSQTDILDAPARRQHEFEDKRQWWPNVTHSPDGHWYAVWDDQRNLPEPTALGEIFFAMYY